MMLLKAVIMKVTTGFNTAATATLKSVPLLDASSRMNAKSLLMVQSMKTPHRRVTMITMTSPFVLRLFSPRLQCLLLHTLLQMLSARSLSEVACASHAHTIANPLLTPSAVNPFKKRAIEAQALAAKVPLSFLASREPPTISFLIRFFSAAC